MNDAGVPCGILVAPLIPGVNDDPEQVGEILRIAHEAGAIGSPVMPLHPRGEVKGIWFEWLRHYRPDLIPRYEELCKRGAYVPTEERKRIQRVVGGVRPRGPRPLGAPRPGTERDKQRDRPAPVSEQRQDTLF